MTTRELTEDQLRVRQYLLSQSERASWLELWPRVMQARIQLIEALRGVTDEQARFSIGPEEWTILEVANHIANNSRQVLATVQALALRERVSAGPNVDDKGDPGEARIQDLRTELIELGVRLSSLIERLPEPAPLDGTHPHVFFGDLHCKAWYLFQRIHDTDHAGQVQKVKDAPGYPAA